MLSIPEGFTSSIPAYTNPIQSLPHVRSLQNKKDTTLLEMALKSSIKQRLFGEILSFNKHNVQNKSHIKSKRLSLQINQRALQKYQLQKGEYGRSADKSLKRYKGYQSPKKSSLENTMQKIRNKEESYQEYLNSAYLQNKQLLKKDRKHNIFSRIQQSKTDFQRHYKNNQSNPQLIQTISKKNSPSFISAIQQNQSMSIDQYNRRQKVLQQNIKKQSFTLPALSKMRNIVDKDKTKKVQKVLFRKQLQKKTTIQDKLWESFCQSQKKNFQNGQSINSSSEVKIGSILQMSSKKFLKKPKQLSKQNFNEFVKSPQINIGLLVNHIITFFELNYKIFDKMKKQDFQRVFSNLANINERVWATCMFRFYDKDKNGQIDSSDLFYLYTQLDDQMNEARIKLKKIQQDKIMEQNKIFRLITQRQNTQLSDISKKQSKVFSNKRKTKKTQLSKLMSNSECGKLDKVLQMQQNIKNMAALQQALNLLNMRIIKMPINSSDQDQINLFKSDRQNSIYLQQALLQKRQLKATDLQLIMKENDFSSNSNHKKVIQIDNQKVNVKLSSVYVQTFVATDHNEQTRLNRQYLEGLKDNIKQFSSLKQKQDQFSSSKKRLKGIMYKEFYQNKLYESLVHIFFKQFGMTVTDPRAEKP